MTVQSILDILRRQYSNSKYHLSNSYIFKDDWESDFFCVSQSEYFYEFEIKMSRQDFFNDFKKYKHSYFRGAVITDEILKTQKIPHRFFFVVPEGLIKPEEVPPYAGLFYIIDRGTTISSSIRQVKPSPFIHKIKFKMDRILLEKHYYRAERLRQIIYDRDYEIIRLKHQLNDTLRNIQNNKSDEQNLHRANAQL